MRPLSIVLAGLILAGALPARAEGPPRLAGSAAIGNETLVANQQVAKAQAAGAITSFMTKGAQECDAEGECRSLFGADDKLDYTSMQSTAQALTGSQAFNFTDKDGSSSSVSAQTSSLAVACGDYRTKTVSGVAFKVTHCQVNSSGDAQLSFKVCSAPTRGLPISPPDNTVECSSNASDPTFHPPAGKICKKAACDTEPEGSLNGWSAVNTVNFTASLPEDATDDEKTENGLGLVFYPPLSGGVPRNFKADSDNLTAVKIVQTFVNTGTGKTALGLRVAYRKKSKVTRDMIMQGAAGVPNPRDHTEAWDTITKLQGNAMLPQYQQKYAQNGTDCLRQIHQGIASDGKIKVCDESFDQNGIKPLARTAQVAAEGQDCGTTQQCLQEVVNTNTWKQTCRSDVPLSLRKCETLTDYTMNTHIGSRTRPTETCQEKRLVTENECTTSAHYDTPPVPTCTPGTWIDRNEANYSYGAWSGADRMLSRFYCDPNANLTSNIIPIQVYAHGGSGACTDWQTISLDFSTGALVTSAATVLPHWGGYCRTVLVSAQVMKTCTITDTRCSVRLTFYGFYKQYLTHPEGYVDVRVDYGTFDMEFLRPGYIAPEPVIDNACSGYEASQ